MADYFTHFSCLLDVGTPERAAAAIAMFQRCRAEDADTDEPQYRGFEISPQGEGHSGTLWIRDDDSGDPDGVVAFVLRLAEELDVRGLWGFDFAHTASRPILGWRDGDRPRRAQSHRLGRNPDLACPSSDRGGSRCLR